MAEKKSRKGILIFLFVLLLAVAGIVWALSGRKTVEKSVMDTENYVPNEEFAPAWNAIQENIKEVKPSYDLEETMRILNSVEVAHYQSGDFTEFLEFMARQDYSKVAPDALKAQAAMMPILQELWQIQNDYKEASDLWTLSRYLISDASYTASQIAEKGEANTDEKSSDNDIAPLINAGKLALSLVDPVTSIAAISTGAVNSAFDSYSRYDKMRKDCKRRLDSVKVKYTEYLTEYYPVYLKYQEEWDRLCLKKDKAYLDIYSGSRKRAENGYKVAEDILREYPENREALLLKSLALIKLMPDPLSIAVGEPEVKNMEEETINQYKEEIEKTLDIYTDLYPSKSAPALCLRGFLSGRMGQKEEAFSYFEQSALEYPRQAEALKDMLDLYRQRAYLRQTAEGKYLLRLYNSTMEGFGVFSPNFQKAMYYESVGDLSNATEEIFRHFYRRSQQKLYDELITDMEFCENNIYPAFRSSLLESSFLSVGVSGKMLSSKLDVQLDNKSDADLDNIRLFLCLHLKDMYPGDFEVVACPSVNKLQKGTSTNWTIGGYKIDDIVSIRAILMTDNKICWVDNIETRAEKAEQQNLNNKTFDETVKTNARKLMNLYHLTEDQIIKMIKSEGQSVLVKSSFMASLVSADSKLEIRLPRLLCMFDPVFFLGEEHQRPDEVRMSGKDIVITFPTSKDKLPKQFPLFVTTTYNTMRIDLSYDGKNISIASISN